MLFFAISSSEWMQRDRAFGALVMALIESDRSMQTGILLTFAPFFLHFSGSLFGWLFFEVKCGTVSCPTIAFEQYATVPLTVSLFCAFSAFDNQVTQRYEPTINCLRRGAKFRVQKKNFLLTNATAADAAARPQPDEGG